MLMIRPTKQFTCILIWVCLAIVCEAQVAAGRSKQLAITIDDPNTYMTPMMTWEERNHAMLKALDENGIQAGLFVCGMRVNNPAGQKLLQAWDNKNHLICNHTYSHHYYHKSSLSADEFIRDFEKGDSIIRGYRHYTKLFRFPFLKEGNTDGKRDSMRWAMQNMGYKNGHVTIDASDWYIDSQVSEALKKNPDVDLTVYRDYYINHILNRAEYYDSLAVLVYQRPIKHTLLIHHSLLNALFLNDLILTLKQHGWEWIDASEAFQDDVFNLQPSILPCGESIVWQSASLVPEIAPTLRYPAEDQKYEEGPLKMAIDRQRKQKGKL